MTGAAPVPDAGYSPRETAAALDALAGFIEDEIAGGQPVKWVAQQAAAGAWHIAAAARDGAA